MRKDHRDPVLHLLHGGGLNGATVLSGAVVARFAHNTILATPLELAKPTLTGPRGLQPVTATAPQSMSAESAARDHEPSAGLEHLVVAAGVGIPHSGLGELPDAGLGHLGDERPPLGQLPAVRPKCTSVSGVARWAPS